MPQAIIFDVDGTLIDSVDLHAAAWLEALRHFGFDPTYEQVRHQIGKGGDQFLPVFVPAELVEQRGEEIKTWRGDLFKQDYLPRVRAFPGVRALFERVRAEGQRVAVGSSANGDELDAYLDICGVADLVDERATKDDAERSKPYPDIFKAVVERLGLEPSQAVAVGDTPYDAQAATRLGLPVVGVLSGGFAERELRDAGCGEVWAGPQDLLDNYAGSMLASRRVGNG